ncbi:Peroxisomal membrane protein PAS20 [Leucoagaricus sp. SymC.cos]|nr:Peroxisomal membrane protein PAS20 [Leucoagaricus sp. SymC.cos]
MGFGGGYGGYGGYGAGLPGMPQQFDAHGNPIPPSLTQALESTTHTTFALLHSIVQTFTGVAQMLESTFMATHSSFFAMVGVVEQFSQLRNAIGSVLGLFGLVRWLKDTITGRHHGAGGLGGEFRDFVQGRPVLPATALQGQQQPKASKKPLIVFLLAIFGIPYAMHKLIKLLSERAALQQQQQQNALHGAGGGGALPPLDPSQLQFARALYPFQASNPNELKLKENEIVAIMAKLDPRTGMEVDPRVVLYADEGGGVVVEGEWWKGRTREGREGWFPKKWVEVLERRKEGDGEAKKVD